MKTILIVDDEFAIADALATLLGEEGYRTLTALSGEKALACLTQDRPDLVLLDLMMPGMSGLEVLRAMRSSPALQEIPVLLMSAGFPPVLGLPEPTQFLRKPLAVEALFSRIAQLLGL
jgi:CheY-like chemotaxis protein